MFRRRGKKDERGSGDLPELPSIYQHVLSHIPPSGPGFLEGGYRLPDEGMFRTPGGVGFAPGAMDGILVHHGPAEGASADRWAAEVYQACVALADRPDARTRSHLVSLLARAHVRTRVDRVLEMIRRRPPRRPETLYAEMHRMLLESGYREVVKFAMAVVATFRRPEDLELIRTLGRHEEFGSFAIKGIAQIVDDPVPEWMEMARRFSGWEKIELVRRLLEDPRPEVCAFLLREGCDNDVEWGYTALPIATGCKLHEALSRQDVDPPLLRGAAVILRALAADAVDGGPDGDMLDYPEGGEATEAFLSRFEGVAETLCDFLAVAAIRDFEAAGFGDERFAAAGWPPARRDRVRATCERILGRPEWRDRALVGLDSPDPEERSAAPFVARRLGAPLAEWFVPRLRKDPLDYSLWFHLAHGADEARIDTTVALAIELLDPESIATGPANERGFGVGYEVYQALDFIVAELRRFPGKGWELIRPSLRSPMIRNRSMAIQALKAWGAARLTPEMVQAVRVCLDDPNKHIREDARGIVGSLERASGRQAPPR